MPSFQLTSHLRAPAERVWAHATSMAGVNHELAPLLRMTHPAHLTSLEGHDAPLGKPLFRSVILLFGVLPIDFDDVTFESLEPGRRFVERSRTLSQHVWRHERTVEPEEGGCRVTDRVTFEPKIVLAAGALTILLRMVFANRHIRLVKMFGGWAEDIQRG
ncbi:MAG: hypothetical protein QM820_14165 [Minicystis sp.]